MFLLSVNIYNFSSKSRNCEYFFPTKGGTGVGNLLPQVSDAGRDILKLMLVYDPENRSNVKRLLEHRYFNDLRQISLIESCNKFLTSSIFRRGAFLVILNFQLYHTAENNSDNHDTLEFNYFHHIQEELRLGNRENQFASL